MTAVGPGKQPGLVGDMSGCMSAIGGNVFMEIYKVRPDVNAIAHSHSPTVIPFSVSQVPLRRCLRTRASLLPVFPYFEIRKVVGMTNLLVSNKMVGKGLAKTGDKPVALMRGRGGVVVGASIPIVTSAPSTRRLRLGCSGKPLG